MAPESLLPRPPTTSSAKLLPAKPGATQKMALRAFFVLDPLQSASFRAIEAIGSLRSSRRNASVSEHFTLNKSRISCAKHPKQLTRGRGLRNPAPNKFQGTFPEMSSRWFLTTQSGK
jgi:hypothetical protein